MAAPTTIYDIPLETLSEIILLSRDTRISIFCSLSTRLRMAAFHTPALWRRLTTTCHIHHNSDDDNKPSVQASYIDFLGWWTDRVKGSNSFVLHFNIEPIVLCDNTCTPLGHYSLHRIFNLVSSARYIETRGPNLGLFCEHLSQIEAPTPSQWRCLQSIVFIPPPDFHWWPGFSDIICVFNLPALKRLRVGNCTTCPIVSSQSYDVAFQTRYQQTWGQLTHLDWHIVVTIPQWRTFVCALLSLQSARLGLIMRQEDPEDEDDGITLNHSVQHTIASLEELWLDLTCIWDPPLVGSVLDGIHLPNLKTLIVESRRLSIDSLHRLLQDKPLVERIRVSAMFPALPKDDYDDDDYNPVAFPSTGDRLSKYAPLLARLVIYLPDLPIVKQSMSEYVDEMLNSQWLQGRNGHMQIVLPWWASETGDLVEILQTHLETRRINGVVIKPNLSPQKYFDLDEDTFANVPPWDQWVDFDAEFCTGHRYRHV
jgi:hypothetical protein